MASRREHFEGVRAVPNVVRDGRCSSITSNPVLRLKLLNVIEHIEHH